MKLTILPTARADIKETVGYLIDFASSATADRFLAAVEVALQHIATQPWLGTPNLVDPSHAQVVRVLHGKRDLSQLL